MRKLLGQTQSLLGANKGLKTQNETLLKANAELASQKASLEAKVKSLLVRKAEVLKSIRKELDTLDSLRKRREIKEKQYDLFEALLAIFSGETPYQDATPEKLASAILELGKGWYPGRPVEELRGIFIRAVCWDYLHSVHCEKCGAHFIVDRAHDSYYRFNSSYECPVCHYSYLTRPDDAFLKAMLSPEQPKDVHPVKE